MFALNMYAQQHQPMQNDKSIELTEGKTEPVKYVNVAMGPFRKMPILVEKKTFTSHNPLLDSILIQ